MDDILEQSSWEGINDSDRSSLDSSVEGPSNCLFVDSMRTLQGSSRLSTMSLTPSSHIRPNLEGRAQNNDVQNSSSTVIAGEEKPYLLNKLLVCNQAQKQQDLNDPVMLSPALSQTQLDRKFPMVGNIPVQGIQKKIVQLSLQRQFQNDILAGSAALQLNSPGPVSPHGASSQIILVIECAIKGALLQSEPVSIRHLVSCHVMGILPHHIQCSHIGLSHTCPGKENYTHLSCIQKQYKVKGISWAHSLDTKENSLKEKLDLLLLGWMVDRGPY